MQIPQSNNLSINYLSRVFDKTVASYKFYWFLSILQLHAKTDKIRFSIWQIVSRMVANAWYPIHYFRLSFGKNDSLYGIVQELHLLKNIPVDASVDEVAQILQDNLGNPDVKKTLVILTKNVPYRFLRPWIDTSDDREVVLRSQKHENGCLYSLKDDAVHEMFVEIYPEWDEYLHRHYSILMDFAYWNLVQFLQRHNPNVPSIPNKIIRPTKRSSLIAQHNYCNAVIHLSMQRQIAI